MYFVACALCFLKFVAVIFILYEGFTQTDVSSLFQNYFEVIYRN